MAPAKKRSVAKGSSDQLMTAFDRGKPLAKAKAAAVEAAAASSAEAQAQQAEIHSAATAVAATSVISDDSVHGEVPLVQVLVDGPPADAAATAEPDSDGASGDGAASETMQERPETDASATTEAAAAPSDGAASLGAQLGSDPAAAEESTAADFADGTLGTGEAFAATQAQRVQPEIHRTATAEAGTAEISDDVVAAVASVHGENSLVQVLAETPAANAAATAEPDASGEGDAARPEAASATTDTAAVASDVGASLVSQPESDPAAQEDYVWRAIFGGTSGDTGEDFAAGPAYPVELEAATAAAAAAASSDVASGRGDASAATQVRCEQPQVVVPVGVVEEGLIRPSPSSEDGKLSPRAQRVVADAGNALCAAPPDASSASGGPSAAATVTVTKIPSRGRLLQRVRSLGESAPQGFCFDMDMSGEAGAISSLDLAPAVMVCEPPAEVSAQHETAFMGLRPLYPLGLRFSGIRGHRRSRFRN